MSRNVKKTRQLCILMVMSLIFSGIYLVNIQVEAAVCSKASDYLISGYFSCVTISQHEQLVSEELAGLRNISEFLKSAAADAGRLQCGTGRVFHNTGISAGTIQLLCRPEQRADGGKYRPSECCCPIYPPKGWREGQIPVKQDLPV